MAENYQLTMSIFSLLISLSTDGHANYGITDESSNTNLIITRDDYQMLCKQEAIIEGAFLPDIPRTKE